MESAMSDPGLPDLPPPDEQPPGGDPGSVPDEASPPDPGPETASTAQSAQTPDTPGTGAAKPVTEPPGGPVDRTLQPGAGEEADE
jgi:hypothetical protein